MTAPAVTTAASAARTAPSVPWNKGKLAGQKPPLKPKGIWTLRTRLQLDGRMRDLTLFDLALDSKLRACDLVRVRLEITEQTWEALTA